jgi:tetratricopeptide (TPR) repeat protein
MINQQQRFQEAMALHTAGNLAAAWEMYQEMARATPEDAGLMHLMGVLAGQAGNLLESVRLINFAIELNPNVPDFYRNLAITYHRLEDYSKTAGAFSQLGAKLTELERFDEAVDAYHEALRAEPINELNASNLGAALNRVGRYAEAKLVLQKALAPDPRMPPALRHWGKGDLGSAYTKQMPALHLNLGNALHGLGDIEAAIASFKRVLELKPDSVLAHYDLGLALLLQGDLQAGWPEFEWRWRQDNYLPHRGFEQPIWQGESPAKLGGPLLISTEQGYGDVIQFARFVPLLADRGYDVLFEVKPELYTLLSEGISHPSVRVIPQGDDPRKIYRNLPFVAHCGVMSLGLRLGITLDNIPATVPYIEVNKQRRKLWAKRLERDRSARKVGIVWGGNPNHPRNFLRSMPPQFWAPLFDQPETTFYSLQKGPAAQYQFSDNATIVTLDPELADFTDTAAAIEQLDLVVGVDTSVVHLAAALGKPAWVMVAPVADWRWGMSGETSPWYPTIRIFRQKTDRDWEGVMREVAGALSNFRS